MDVELHQQKFQTIIEKYSLNDPAKAEEIAAFLTGAQTSPSEFARLFAMSEEEAGFFLSFIQRGLNFKKKHLDGVQ